MKITKAEDYALTLSSALAAYYPKGFLSLEAVAEVHHLPQAFLKKIARQMKTAGLLEVREGKNGGYRLSKNPEAVSVGEILEAFNPQLLITACVLNKSQNKCPHFALCSSRGAWSRISRDFYRHLKDIKLTELLAN